MNLSLSKWVYENGGPAEVSKLLKVQPHAIRVWLRGDGTPTMKLMVKLIRLSENRLTFEGIVDHATRNQRKKKRKC